MPSTLRTSDSLSGQPLLSSPDSANEPDDRPLSRGRPLSHDGYCRPASPLHSPFPSTVRSPTTTAMHTPMTSRPPHLRRSTFRSRSPSLSAQALAASQTRQGYIYAAGFLLVSLVSFTIQTELAAYVQHDLGWDKAYCMLYLTHGSWVLLWPVQLLLVRIFKRDVSWPVFWRRHVWILGTTALMVERQDLDAPNHAAARRHGGIHSPWPYLLRTTAIVTTALTVAGLSWYVAVNKTTPSDLTAIYNCSAFFAYAFSVPLLKEKLRFDKSLAVAVAIAGVLVVAYGDTKASATDSNSPSTPQHDLDGPTRFRGNVIIGLGSVLYGLYEVLYKRLACPPEGVSPVRGIMFANLIGTLIGFFTLTVLWVPLPILHLLGWETFSLPTGRTLHFLLLSILMNAIFAGSFLILISLTSPVLSSVAALLTIFIVALVDWSKPGGQPPSLAALLGGTLIIAAFSVLSWSTWREMIEGRTFEGDDVQLPGHGLRGGGGDGGAGSTKWAKSSDGDTENDDDGEE